MESSMSVASVRADESEEYFQHVGYRNDINTQHNITLDLDMTGDSTGSVDSTDKTTFSLKLQDKVVVDRLSDMFISSIMTYNTKLNTSSDNANFILKISEFSIHTNANQQDMFSKIVVPNHTTARSQATNHNSDKLSYVCALNPMTIANLSGSITMNDGGTILDEDSVYAERENNQIFSVLAGPGYGGSTDWFNPWKHVLEYNASAFTALGLGDAAPSSSAAEADTAYAHSLQLNHKIEYVRVNGGTSSGSQKHIGEVDENGVRAAIKGEVIYHKHWLDDGKTDWDDATHVRDHGDSHQAIEDFNVTPSITHDYSNADEMVPFGKIKTTDDAIDTSRDSDSVYLELEDDANQLTRGHMKIGTQNGARTAMASPGTSIWLKISEAPTTFRCLIELVIIPRGKDLDMT
jgi:hypothetical protein